MLLVIIVRQEEHSGDSNFWVNACYGLTCINYRPLWRKEVTVYDADNFKSLYGLHYEFAFGHSSEMIDQ